MGLPRTDFKKDIVLDDLEFQRAVKRFDDLSNRINTLQEKVSKSLEDLRSGFDTPAGHKFFDVCGTKLLDPMKDQARVIKHVSDNLKDAKNSYQSVFDEFIELNNSIRNIK